jgi:hypothetical protein
MPAIGGVFHIEVFHPPLEVIGDLVTHSPKAEFYVCPSAIAHLREISQASGDPPLPLLQPLDVEREPKPIDPLRPLPMRLQPGHLVGQFLKLLLQRAAKVFSAHGGLIDEPPFPTRFADNFSGGSREIGIAG